MTIAAAYLTSEGVVLGADSTTTIASAEGVQQVLNHAQKVFEVGRPGDGRLGLCTWGSGSIGQTSHRTLAARLADVVDAKGLSVAAAAKELTALVTVECQTQSFDGFVGYYLGGCDLGSHVPACFQVKFDKREAHSEQLGIGAMFSGAPEFFTRVFRGYDARLHGQLRDAIKRRLGGNLPAQFDKHYAEAFEEVARPLMAAGFQDIPIREAIDFVHTYIHITVKAFKFRYGVPICGGPIEVGFVTTDRRFRWAFHKGFTSAALEHETMP